MNSSPVSGPLALPGAPGRPHSDSTGLLRRIGGLLHPARWGLLLVAVAVVALWVFGIALSRPAAEGQLLSDARVVRGFSPGRDEFPATATAVSLPHVWTRSPRDDGPAWYRLTFDRPQALTARNGGAMTGALIEQVCASFEVHLNGELVAVRGEPTESAPTDCLEPVLMALPTTLLKAQGNVLDIRVAGLPLPQVAARERAGQLAPVRIGGYADLETLHGHLRDFNLGATHALATVAGVIGLAALALKAVSQLPYFGYFGAASLGWSILVGLLSGASLPLPPVWTELLICTLAPPVAVAGVLFLLRYCGLRIAWIDIALAGQCIVVPASLALAAPERLHSVALPWALILATELLAALGVFLRRAWRYSRADFRIGATASATFLLVLAAELLLSPGALVLPGKLAVSFSVIVMFGGMVWRMHQLFQGAIAAAEQGRVQAERRAQDIAANMEQNFGQMAELRVEQVTAKERKRIAADLHDDLGAKLLTIVHTADNDRISTLAREALEEMRLSVRGLTGRAMQIGDAIGDWRSELMTRFSNGGVELVWHAPDDLLMSERAMSARAYVQTTRILREAVSNVLKHSGASRCEVSLRQDHNDFELTISDNGKGIPTELDGKLDRGHGMSTMKGRAKQLQGQCLVESGPGYGTTIRLTLPL